MAEFVPGFNVMDPSQPFSLTPAIQTPMLPPLPAWAQQAPTISPAAGAAATMPAAATGGGADPTTAALLSKILSNPALAANPAYARILAYNQLQQANPGTGPFTNIVNPIVNALTARRLAPYVQQQQQQAQLKQTLDMLKTVTGIQGLQATTRKTTAEASDLEGKARDFESLSQPEKDYAIRVANKVAADPNAALRSKDAANAIIAASDREARREQAAADRQTTHETFLEGMQTRKEQQQNRVESYRAQNKMDLQDERLQRMEELQGRLQDQRTATTLLSGQRQIDARKSLQETQQKFQGLQNQMGRELRVSIANMNANLTEGRLNFDQNREDRIIGSQLINNAFRYSSTLGKDDQQKFLTDLGPLLKRYNPSIDFNKVPQAEWYNLWLKNPELQITPTPGSQQPIPQGTVLTPPSQYPRVTAPTLPPVDPSVRPYTPQETRLATPTGQSYSNVPADLSTPPAATPPPAPPTVTLGPGAAAPPTAQPGPVQVDPTTLGVNPNFLYPAQVPYVNPPAGTAPTLQDNFNSLFQASDAYMGNQ